MIGGVLGSRGFSGFNSISVQSENEYIGSGLVFWLNGDDAKQTGWIDRIGNKSISLYNCVAKDGYVEFNGTNSYGKTNSFFFRSYNDTTLEVVFKMNAYPGTQEIYVSPYNGTIGLAITTAGGYVFTTNDTHDYPSMKTVDTNIKVISLTGSYAYENCIYRTFNKSDYLWNKNTNFNYIGRRLDEPEDQKYLNGRIYQIRLYNRVLTYT